MASLSFGIDINGDLLTGVAVAGNGKETKTVSCAFCQLTEDRQLAEQLPVLLKELQYSDKEKGRCDIGLALVELSLRNITLPFTDSKKIEQILPFELDEQLVLPADQQIIATHAAVVDKKKGETQLIAAALEKENLSQYLALFRTQGIEANKVCSSDFVLAEKLTQIHQETANFFILSCNTSSATITVVHQGAVAFMRRLAYPTEVFTESLFSFDGKTIHTADADRAEQAVEKICQSVQQYIDIFRYQFSKNLQPDSLLLTGSMLLGQGFQEKIASAFTLPVKRLDLIDADTGTLSTKVASQWQPELFDRPLALALQAAHAGKKNTAFNFRKNEFALQHHLLGSKKQLIGLAVITGGIFLIVLGSLFVNVQQLKKQHSQLSNQMNQLFQTSFPGIRPSGDPLLHMRSKLQGMGTVSVSMPIFSEEKRVLFVLYDISSRIPDMLDLHITRLLIEQDAVRLTGTTDAFKNVDTIKGMLAQSDRYSDVNILSAANSKEGKGVRFEMRLQLTKIERENS